MFKKIKAKLRSQLYESAAKYALKKGINKRFMNFGYKGGSLDLKPEDISEQLSFQLYNVISAGVDIKGKSVLEIGCGRGGGCYFFTEYKQAHSVIAIDESKSNIELAQKLVGEKNSIYFVQSAENMNLFSDSFEVIVNLESSHCYSSKGAFLKDVFKYLKPGGAFIYADIFVSANLQKVKDYLISLGFTIETEQDISHGVLESLKERPAEQVSGFKKYMVPLFLDSFYGYEQSTIFKELTSEEKKYYSFICRKQGK
ncbi:MAG TPA: class I SAM-dependent methyltransferase [Bacteroidia bacterium]|jgi:ubiquinone/menaquinone biosynthesis C-methylase UbiE|nr:class I SAM-dependent methyltransferase [Bacteroidia bacterium]